MDLEKDAKGVLDREESKQVDTDGDRTSKRSFVAESETEDSKTEDDILWPCDASKRYGKRLWYAGMRREKKEEKPTKEEVDAGNTHDVMDEFGGAEGCGGGAGRVEKTDHVNR